MVGRQREDLENIGAFDAEEQNTAEEKGSCSDLSEAVIDAPAVKFSQRHRVASVNTPIEYYLVFAFHDAHSFKLYFLPCLVNGHHHTAQVA